MPDSVPTQVYAVIDKLAALALPPEQHYHVSKRAGPSYLKLSESQMNLVQHMALDWSDSMKIASHLLNDNHGRRVLGWLQEKYETLKAALDRGDALYFDVLVLGLVRVHPPEFPDESCLTHLPAQDATQCLAHS